MKKAKDVPAYTNIVFDGPRTLTRGQLYRMLQSTDMVSAREVGKVLVLVEDGRQLLLEPDTNVIPL